MRQVRYIVKANKTVVQFCAQSPVERGGGGGERHTRLVDSAGALSLPQTAMCTCLCTGTEGMVRLLWVVPARSPVYLINSSAGGACVCMSQC